MDAAAWSDLTTYLEELGAIEGAASLLSWDQQVSMPEGGAAIRGDQLAALSRVIHERCTAPQLGDWLSALEESPSDPVQAATAKVLRKRYDHATRVSADLVARIAKAETDGFEAWLKARAESDFSLFEGPLRLLVDLCVERAEAIGCGKLAYDVVVDDHDPGVDSAFLATTFSRLQAGLTELLQAIRAFPTPEKLGGNHDISKQRALHLELVKAIGYDLKNGRIDDAEHPFTVGIGKGDCRITTHYYPGDLLSGLGGTIHETGHALYEQGMPHHLKGTLLAECASLGMHESQSRFWENFIARSLPFCRWLTPRMNHHLGTNFTSEGVFRASNRVEPGLIRIYSDEVTYNLHIIIRVQLEQALFSGDIRVGDLPLAWNAKYEEFLGIRPDNDVDGVLQDVHWSAGLFGYFPSYTLGNMYMASMAAVIREAQPHFWDNVEQGQFGDIRAWLRKNIHNKGKMGEPADILRAAMGPRDHVEDLLAHLWERYGAIYPVQRPG